MCDQVLTHIWLSHFKYLDVNVLNHLFMETNISCHKQMPRYRRVTIDTVGRKMLIHLFPQILH